MPPTRIDTVADDDGLRSSRHGVDPLALAASPVPRTLAARAYEALHDAIVTAKLRPGQRVRLDELAQLLGMSVMPVREALRRLEAVSLVQFEPHRGATVASLSTAELNEVFGIRAMVEPAAIARAAPEFTAEDAADAAQALAAYEAALVEGRFAAATDAHQRFHLALYRAEHHPWLVRTLMPLWEASARYWHWLTTHAGWEPDQRRAAHETLLALCVEHDGDGARDELAAHLALGHDILRRTLEQANGAG